MRKTIILGISFIIIFFSFLVFLYLRTNDEEKSVEKIKNLELVEKENAELLEEKIESSNIIEDVTLQKM